MWSARTLLRAGLRKTIGSGILTSVWRDPWLPEVPARPARSIGNTRPEHLSVSDLIRKDNKEWDLPLIKSVIVEEDIPLITIIKLSKVFSEDSYCWSYTKSGKYSVKSGYWLAKKQDLSRGPLYITEPSIVPLQAQAWKLRTTRKIKHFIWQVTSGCLATKQNLLNRHIGADNMCPRCEIKPETTNHLLFECPSVRQIWTQSPFGSDPSSFSTEALYTNMDFLFWRLKTEDTELDHVRCFPWILWMIWKARNDKVFNGINRPPIEIINKAVSECKEWFEANKKPEQEDSNNVSSNTSLIAETYIGDMALKCKTDAAWKENEDTCGFGWCLFEVSSYPIHVGLKGTRRCLSATHAELLGLIWAMQCIVEIKSPCRRFETDCKDLLSITESPQDWPIYQAELADFTSLKGKIPSSIYLMLPELQILMRIFLPVVRELAVSLSRL